MYKNFGKRFIDLLASVLCILILLPIFLLVSVCIFVEDRGPIFFIHGRIGKNNQHFNIIKFRSMRVGTEIVPSCIQVQMQVTKVGRLIRRLNIDELPQLINVILGEMSLIGPRPGLENQVELHNLRSRKGVQGLTPGITGLAQIHGFDGMSVEQKVLLDEEYLHNVNLYFDFKILLGTVKYLFKKQPIY
jgi:O-antigen biosynthesis protein WbqP